MDENTLFQPMKRMPFEGWHGIKSVCGVTIDQDHEKVVVVFTELSDNPGCSVTSSIEILTTKIIKEFDTKGRDLHFRFYEHYPESKSRKETFDRIIYKPEWSRLTNVEEVGYFQWLLRGKVDE